MFVVMKENLVVFRAILPPLMKLFYSDLLFYSLAFFQTYRVCANIFVALYEKWSIVVDFVTVAT